jgi:putative heme iron utilization protein
MDGGSVTDMTTAREHAASARTWAEVAADHLERGELDQAQRAAGWAHRQSERLIGEIALMKQFAAVVSTREQA